MSLSTPTVVGSAEGSNIGSLDVTLTAGVAATTDTATSTLWVITQVSVEPGAFVAVKSVTDNAGTQPLRGGRGNGLSYCVGAQLFTQYNNVANTAVQGDYALEMRAGYLYKSLTAGDIVSVVFEGGSPLSFPYPVSYARAVLVAVTGGVVPNSTTPPLCVINCARAGTVTYGNPAVGGVAGGSTGFPDSNAITTGDLVLQLIGQSGTAGVSSLTFADGATTLDSWYDRGGSAHCSGKVGYLVAPSGTEDFGCTTDVTALPNGLAEVWTNILAAGPGAQGLPYCSAGGNPVFDNKIKISPSE